MQNFYFSQYILSIKAETSLILPAYKGSTLRGGFGHAFRRIVCVFKGRECAECLLKEQCVYSWVFETPVPKEAEMMRKYTAAPHPFVIEPDLEINQNDRGITFGLILIGRAVEYLPYFIYAFVELGHIGIGRGKGKYQLLEVAEKNPQGLKVIYRARDQKLLGNNGLVRWADIVETPPPSRISVSFLTPTRIKYENTLTKDFEFHVLFRNLLRRISLLYYFHCGKKLDDSGFKELIELAKEIKIIKKALYWQDWERYSNRQETRMKMGGIMGDVVYEGDLAFFWPYIKLGEYVHVGKGSSFGLGKYKITSPVPST